MLTLTWYKLKSRNCENTYLNLTLVLACVSRYFCVTVWLSIFLQQPNIPNSVYFSSSGLERILVLDRAANKVKFLFANFFSFYSKLYNMSMSFYPDFYLSFILILPWIYPCFLSLFHPDFILVFLNSLYPNFILILFWFYLDKMGIKSWKNLDKRTWTGLLS